MFNLPILILFAIIAFVFCFIVGMIWILNFKKTEQMIKGFGDYTTILQYHMEKAYDIIHQDRILVYSLEATHVPEEHINIASKDFITLVQKLIGPRLYKEFIFLYGNYETFAFALAEYFSSRYENDEIRKDSIKDMRESELEI